MESYLQEKIGTIKKNIENNIDFEKDFLFEKEFHNWFKENYKLLGFDKLIVELKRGFPDFIMEMDGAILRIEIETVSSNFILHKHDPKKVDLVICMVKDRDLCVPIIEIRKFGGNFPHKTIIVTSKIKKRLDRLKLVGCESDNMTIERVLDCCQPHLQKLVDEFVRKYPIIKRRKEVINKNASPMYEMQSSPKKKGKRGRKASQRNTEALQDDRNGVAIRAVQQE